jgi:hypothetical protein
VGTWSNQYPKEPQKQNAITAITKVTRRPNLSETAPAMGAPITIPMPMQTDTYLTNGMTSGWLL